MKQLRLFTSNRLEILAETLAQVLSTPLKSPLDPETILLQSSGMKRWTSMELARYHGICANVRFLFPNEFVYENFQKIFSDLPEQSPYAPEIMMWKIMKHLPSCIRKPAFESLRSYFHGTGESLRRFQLSERIARTYDQYLVFRPEMIFNWEKGKDAHWQAILWRELVQGNEEKHRAALAKRFFESIQKDPRPNLNFPERISAFGISNLPRFHLQLLDALSWFAEVNLFLMNPCEQYWGDILSNREKKRLTSGQGMRNIDKDDLYLEQGNSLLGSMGMLGRDFFDLIHEFAPDDYPIFEDPGESRLLLCLQSDIMNLRERGNDTDGKTMVSENDFSIQIHACHSPMREMEVLHDRLLELFERDPDLMPKDILVMMPDIEAYSPYIQAVFDLPSDDPQRIPFSIADRSIRAENRIVDIFLRIPDLTGTRFETSQVFSILEHPAVFRRFDLTEADVGRIRRWVQDTHIRWGIDAQNRETLGLPGLPENTWVAGLERLVLGYAMPGKEEKMFKGILPYDPIEGNEVAVLGKFLEFTSQLFTWTQSLEKRRTLAEWSDTLKDILDGFFKSDDDTEEEIQTIRTQLTELSDMQNLSDFSERLDIRVIIGCLGNYFKKEPSRFGFITGGVTFCAMVPMRSIPFKILCLVGMNSDAYPRESRPLGFDLMAKHPKPGDPSRRNDDRYLFLESILSAREKLYVSYMGQRILDNAPVPPSVLVSELMDYIETGFDIPGKRILEDHIVVRHRLQAFSPEYFKKGKREKGSGNPRLFSYSEENLRAARCLLENRKPGAPFISEKLSDPETELKTVGVTELCKFFSNPAKFLLNKRLRIFLEENQSVLEGKEWFHLDRLDKYVLEQHLVGKKLDGRDLRKYFMLKKASGELPHGTVGECVYERFVQGVERFVEKIQPYVKESPLHPLEVDLKLNGFELTGRIDNIYPQRLVHHRYATIKPKDRLRTWIHHLVLNCETGGRDPSYPQTSMLAGSDAIWEYNCMEHSEAILEKLLEKYWEGLRRPLHFFPKASWKYVESVIGKNTPDNALRSVRSIWTGNSHVPGEISDAYFQLCFKEIDPLDSEFENISLEIFEPMIKSQNLMGM